MTTKREVAPFLPPEGSVEEIQARGPWMVEGPDSADWALAKLAAAREEIAEIERQAEAARAMIEARRLKVIERIGREAAFFESAILTYAQAHRGEIVDGKRKSRDYLHGRISFRSKAGRLVVEDKAALVTWLESQAVELGLSRVVLEPDKKAIDAWFDAGGREAPPGTRYENPAESISIEALAPERALEK